MSVINTNVSALVTQNAITKNERAMAGAMEQLSTGKRINSASDDTSSSAGKCFFDMLGVFAEFETNLRRERQLEGIAKAKLEGKYKGRKRSVDGDKVTELYKAGMGASKIAQELGIGRASVYRYLR